ncbi:MAG: hypothetical protein NZ750_01370 [Anaerolineae bacterium]|nr:hypothetical protein [Anaerolineae bacterium]MDW8173235.1 hypothetical protein [Anaerolineae bacterium]
MTASATSTAPQRPLRPFGLSLAILASAILFGLLPIAENAITLALSNYQIIEEGLASGIRLSNYDPSASILQIVLSGIFLLLAILTWRGRPQAMRYAFPLAVLAFALGNIVWRLWPALSMPANLLDGIDSAREVAQSYLRGQLVITILTAAYCLWFSNRWSARAFFRGYYTDYDLTMLAEHNRSG